MMSVFVLISTETVAATATVVVSLQQTNVT